MVKFQPSKLAMRVRFPLPALPSSSRMILTRRWISCLLAGSLQWGFLCAQEDGGELPAAMSGAPSSSPILFSQGSSSSSTESAGPTEAPSQAPSTPAPPVKISGGYGQLPVEVAPSGGRFAQPALRYTLSISQGYDDNIFTTANNVPDPEPTVMVIPEQPDQTIITPTGPIFIKGTPERKTVIPPPEQATLEPTASAITTAQLETQLLLQSPRTAIAGSANISSLYYWNRQDKSVEYNGGANVSVSHALSPRARTSLQASASYENQPDFTVQNSPTQSTAGAYIRNFLRGDFSYRWTPRISTLTSAQSSGTIYEEDTQQGDNVITNTLGQEVRWLATPRVNLVGEYRYEWTVRDNAANDYTTHYVLFGSDFELSRRLNFTLRAGESLRTFSQAESEQRSSPHVETTLMYLYGKGSRIGLTSRYGFETSDPFVTTTSLRTNININHVLTARTSANARISYNHLSREYEDGSESTTEGQLDLTLGMQYILTARGVLYWNYTFTDVDTEVIGRAYRRNRTFIGINYTF